jgi:SAM-dependent methyltransferase
MVSFALLVCAAIVLQTPSGGSALGNPWLDIPVEDYEGHMGSPEVDQSGPLARVFERFLQEARPRELLLLGCGPGGGLDRVDPAVTAAVTAVDLSPSFLDELRRRFPAPGFRLTLECADVLTMTLPPGAYDAVHAALLFEYLDWRALLPRLAATLRAGGSLGVVLQLPSASAPAVTPSPFASLQRLVSVFQFVDEHLLTAAAREHGLALASRREEPLKQGKRLAVLRFGKG